MTPAKTEALVSFVILGFFIILSGCTLPPDKEQIRIGLQFTPASTLVQVADEKGFFKDAGLDVRIEEFTAGKFALQALLAGSVDFATPAELPVMLAKMQGNRFYVLASIGENENEAPMLVWKDESADIQEYFLKSKRKLSTSLGGSPEYSTYLFLKHFNIPSEQVEIIAQKPEEMIGAFSNRSVDAIVIFEPYPSLAEEFLVEKTRRFSLPAGTYAANYLFVADAGFVDKNPEKTRALLKALMKAEKFVAENPAEAQGIVSRRTKFSLKIIQKIWPDFVFSVKIPGYLVSTWENEADWAIETGKTKQVSKPNFQELLRPDLLEQAASS